MRWNVSHAAIDPKAAQNTSRTTRICDAQLLLFCIFFMHTDFDFHSPGFCIFVTNRASAASFHIGNLKKANAGEAFRHGNGQEYVQNENILLKVHH
jgi:hypothetical protein